MSGLAVAVFAAAVDEHVIEAPRSRRFDLFRRSFDEDAYRRRLAAAGLSWVGRGDAHFPARLRSDPRSTTGSLRASLDTARPR